MKKKIIIAGIILLGLYLGARGYIASKGEAYFREYVDAENRALQGKGSMELTRYEGDFSGATAQVKVKLNQGIAPALKDPLLLEFHIGNGPLFAESPVAGLIRWETRMKLADLLKPDEAKSLAEDLKEPVTLRYDGAMAWDHRVEEHYLLSKIESKEGKGSRFSLAPTTIQGSFDPKTLAGRWNFESAKMQASNPREGVDVRLEGIHGEAAVDAIEKEGPIFGSYAFGVDHARILDPRSGLKTPILFHGDLKLGLKKEGSDRASFSVGIDLSSEDAGTRKLWEGIRQASLDLKMQGLGIQGLRDLAQLQKKEQHLREQLAQAVGAKDDIAMQRTILALQALQGDWVKIYNDLLLPGVTTLHLDEQISTEKTSRLVLDLRYTGKALKGDSMSAMISLMAHLDRLAEGKVDLTLEKKLAQRLYPNAVFVLDSMVSKNMATLKGGVYRFHGELKDGKIIVNGTRYAPQEFVMMILM